MTHSTSRQDQQVAWIERLRQLRRDRARRTELDCLAASETATNDRLESAAQLEVWSQRRDRATDDLSNDPVEASQLVQFAHRQSWMDQELQRAQFALARAEHCEQLKRDAADKAARHALQQSIQYEKVVEWRKSL